MGSMDEHEAAKISYITFDNIKQNDQVNTLNIQEQMGNKVLVQN